MRCPRCGNENSEENRFCGMCGAALLTAPVPVASAQAKGTAKRLSSSELPEGLATPQTAPSQESRGISGPSFLGLNDPAPLKRASLSVDPHTSASSGNLDYLLEDEDEPHRGGAGKFILILLALALAVGFGYLRWKNQGLEWLRTIASKQPAAAQKTAPQSDDSPDTSSTASSSSPSPSIQLAEQPAAQSPTPSQSPANPTASASNAPAASPSTDSATGKSPATSAPSTEGATATSGASKPESATAESNAEPPPAKDAAATSDNSPATPAKSKKVPDTPAPKPPAAVKPANAADAVSEAHRLIYGRGVNQDCDRGLRLLKPAANQSNPKAMIEMGALYSAGLCTPRDLPTAYRWFALALRKDPENQSVQTDLQKLWGEMTQPERQLAIKLSQ